MINFKNKSYIDDEYTSIFIGNSLLMKKDPTRYYFYDDIYEYYYTEELEEVIWSAPCMTLGEAFEFSEIDDELYYTEYFEPTNDLDVIAEHLPCTVRDNCKKIFKRRFIEKLDRKFNYLIIAPHMRYDGHNMRYDGHIGRINNKLYGEIVFLGVYKGF